MRKLLTLCSVVVAFSTLAFAGNWTGRLVDATCYSAQQSQPNPDKITTCAAKSSTSLFAIESSGKVYKFDAAGNTKAAEALKSHADRSADPESQTAGPVTVQVTGSIDGEMLRVETIKVK